jgi:tetratricopeptide (TPR) repeat protein
MSNHTSKPSGGKANGSAASSGPSGPSGALTKGSAPAPVAASKAPPAAEPAAATSPAPPTALFRRVDWVTALAAALVTLIGYYITLAPDLTLEDSGELATASMYAGVPHPPGYPVWTLYTWLFTVLVPHANMAWRVALASAVAGAATCGLLALITSRGTSMILESIDEFKALDRRIENALCSVAGWVAGTLFGFNGFMWSQAVIVEVYTLSALSLMAVFVCLMRWNHAPDQRRHLYWAFFWFGICFTNHQTLIVAAPGIELGILARDPKLGRRFFWVNSFIFVLGLFIKGFVSTGAIGNPAVFNMFLIVGIASMLITFWFGVEGSKEGKAAVAAAYGLIALFIWVAWANAVQAELSAKMDAAILPEAGRRIEAAESQKIVALRFMVFFQSVALLSLTLARWLDREKEKVAQWFRWGVSPVALCGVTWLLGCSFYFYMPLASLSNPPLNWGYPRIIDGFIHALTRGQYEKTNPTTELQRWIEQVTMLKEGAMEEFTPVLLIVALVPLFFFVRMKARERAWLVGLGSSGLCLAFILLFLLNPSGDRQSRELTKVFFTASHITIAAFIGWGLALVAAWLARDYERRRRPFLIAVAVMAGLAMYQAIVVHGDTGLVRSMPRGKAEALWDLLTSVPAEESQYLPDRLAAKLGFAWMGLLILFVASYRRMVPLGAMLALFTLMPAQAIISHWAKNEQRGHMFGYWFGHDMFTPPYVDKNNKLSYEPKEREELLKKGDKRVYPEMARDAVLFGGTDPGRFCPTYMIFCESFTPPRHKPRDPLFDRRDVYIITQNALADGTYLNYIRAHFNRSAQVDPPFFASAISKYQHDFQDKVMGGESLTNKLQGRPHATNGLERAVATVANIARPVFRPLDNFSERLGDRIEKSRRTEESLFTESHFTDIPALARRLASPDAGDLVSRFLSEQLRAGTRQLLSSAPTDARTRRALARDLNALLENEYTAVRRLKELKPDLAASEAQLKELAAVASGETVTPGAALDAELRARGFWIKDPEGKKRLIEDLIAREKKERDKLATELAKIERVPVLYETNRFAGVQLSRRSQRFIAQNPTGHSRIRLNRLLLEEAYPTLLAKSNGGVYPDLEILTPSVTDSQKAFNDYVEDATRRARHDKEFPNEPKQVKPGEDIRWEGNRLSVQGQVAVMSINGLLTKMIFDANPDHEFYVEESFPLDWMYPYLTPHGIIMKINRQPLAELPDEVIDRDHEFWSQYSRRFIGNWITYDTPISNLCAFAEKVYLRHELGGFQGDPAFVRDDQGQKAFSKLRSAIAGVYYWRINFHAANPVAQQKMIREAEFAFKQAFAYCPFSPEALFRFSNLIVSLANMEASRGNLAKNQAHMDDAIRLTQTFIRLDPGNPSARELLKNLTQMKGQFEQGLRAQAQARSKVNELAAAQQSAPTNFQNALALVQVYAQMGDTNKALAVLDPFVAMPASDVGTLLTISDICARLGDHQRKVNAALRAVQVGERVLATPAPDARSLMELAQAYNMAFDMRDTNNVLKLERVMLLFNRVAPGNPEGLYDLAAIEANLGKTNEAIAALAQSIALSDARLVVQRTNVNDLRRVLQSDIRFTNLAAHPSFRLLFEPK